MYRLHKFVLLENINVSVVPRNPPHVKILSSSTTTRQESKFSISRSGKVLNICPLSVDSMLDRKYKLDPPAITSPQDSELPYPVCALASAIVPEMTHSSDVATYL